jgi:single-stranded DNA-binding protein
MPPINLLVLSGAVVTAPRGRLAPEPEASRCRLTLEVPGENGRDPVFLAVDIWGRLAEVACGLTPGTQVCLSGKLVFRGYAKPSGKKYGTLALLADGLVELAPQPVWMEAP